MMLALDAWREQRFADDGCETVFKKLVNMVICSRAKRKMTGAHFMSGMLKMSLFISMFWKGCSIVGCHHILNLEPHLICRHVKISLTSFKVFPAGSSDSF